MKKFITMITALVCVAAMAISASAAEFVPSVVQSNKAPEVVSATDKDGNTLTLIDVIADKSDIADEIDTKIKVEKLRVILPVCLTERERLIIEMRYGLCGREELTQREIAKKLNISRSYVSRIEKSALEKLRKQF